MDFVERPAEVGGDVGLDVVLVALAGLLALPVQTGYLQLRQRRCSNNHPFTQILTLTPGSAGRPPCAARPSWLSSASTASLQHQRAIHPDPYFATVTSRSLNFAIRAIWQLKQNAQNLGCILAYILA